MFYAAIAAVLLPSCTRESIQPDPESMDFFASWVADGETVSALTNDGHYILWPAASEIEFFNLDTHHSGKFISSNTPTARTTFKGPFMLSRSAYYVAVYPYNLTGALTGSGVYLTLPDKQNGMAGTIDNNFFPAIAPYTTSTNHLYFYSVCGGIRFSVTRENITKITFKSNDGSPIAGKVEVGYYSSEPQIKNFYEPVDSVMVIAPEGGFIPGEYYFAAMLPQTHAQGLSVTVYTATRRATKSIDNAINVKRSIFVKLDNLDDELIDLEEDEDEDEQEIEGGGTRSGLYLGIIGFNQQLYKMPIERLNSISLTRFNSFIDNLSSQNGTLLYYSVDQSIRTLSRARYPDDLFNVSLVTFTDGLDQGSAMMIEDYPGDDSYLNRLNRRLLTKQIYGIPITAYSVGLKGSDVTDAVKFNNNIQKLANPSSNAFLASSISTVNSRFAEIADEFSQTITIYNLIVSIPGPANGTRVRFTFDNNDASYSHLYVEGVFDLSSKSLTNVVCNGLTFPNDGTVQGEADGIFVRFAFNGIMVQDKSIRLSQSDIKQWNYNTSTSRWQINSEFNSENDAKVEMARKSAVLLLNLDCSSSLGSDFSTLKTYAKSFIDRLYKASIDPYEVTGIKLDKTTLKLYKDGSYTLVATISPSTAADKSVSWTSSNEAVAIVNSEGVVTAVSNGTAEITATTRDNGFTAKCAVTVIKVPEMVDLGLSVKWAPLNLGATNPEECGNYYAWGETEPKGIYSWSTYKWCMNGSSSQLTKYCNKSSCGYNGFTDNKTILDPEDDAAAVALGGSWRMATPYEWNELKTKCTWTWRAQNGVNGSLVTGPNGNRIFLPAAGYRNATGLSNAGSYGYYWSSSLYTGSPSHACYRDFGSNGVGWYDSDRCHGQSVRPVSE